MCGPLSGRFSLGTPVCQFTLPSSEVLAAELAVLLPSKNIEEESTHHSYIVGHWNEHFSLVCRTILCACVTWFWSCVANARPSCMTSSDPGPLEFCLLGSGTRVGFCFLSHGFIPPLREFGLCIVSSGTQLTLKKPFLFGQIFCNAMMTCAVSLDVSGGAGTGWYQNGFRCTDCWLLPVWFVISLF